MKYSGQGCEVNTANIRKHFEVLPRSPIVAIHCISSQVYKTGHADCHSYRNHPKQQKILSVANIVIPKLDNIVPAANETRSFTTIFTLRVVPH